MRVPPLLVASLLAGACASSRPEGVAVPAPAAPLPPVDATALPASFRAVLGFDAPVAMDAEDAVQPGDRLLYRIRLDDGGEVREWFARVELDRRAAGTMRLRGAFEGSEEEIVESPLWLCVVEVLDVGSGEVVSTDLVVPEVAMLVNLYDVGVLNDRWRARGLAAEDWAERVPEADRRRFLIGASSALAMFDGWSSNDTLAPILRQVVGRPTLGALRSLLTGTFSYSLEFDDEGVRAASFAPDGGGVVLDAYRVPGWITLGGRTLLLLEIVAVEAAAPLSVGMGVVGVRGVHPTDPSRRVDVELLGARRAD